MTTLYLKKMGCDFFKGDTSTKASDVGNYRVRVAYRNKNGELVHGDFSRLPLNNTITTDLQVGYSRHLIKGAGEHHYTIADILKVVNSDSAIQYDNAEVVEDWPTITRETAKVGQAYGFCAGWQYVTKVWELTDSEMQENDLYCRTRVESINFKGTRCSYGL